MECPWCKSKASRFRSVWWCENCSAFSFLRSERASEEELATGWFSSLEESAPIVDSPYSFVRLVWSDVQEGPNHVPGVSIA